MFEIRKTWDGKGLISAYNVEIERDIYLSPIVWVKNPNNVPGLYQKSSSDFILGVEEGHKWWAIGSPRIGRFEYTVTVDEKRMVAAIQILQNCTIYVHVWCISDIDGPMFFWKGNLFTEDDLMLELYLENKHDYSDSDMVYATGKRKYSNELVQLIPKNGQQSDRED